MLFYFDAVDPDERSHVIVELLQHMVVHVNHVPGLVVVVADVSLQAVGNREMMHFENALEERRRPVVVAAG